MGLCLPKLASVYYIWQSLSFSLSAFLGARAAELLIDADQNPQRGGNRPQTLHCLRLPRARSHCCWLHSVQPQLWVCHRSWRYDYGGVSTKELCFCLCLCCLCLREERHRYLVIQSDRFVLKFQWTWSFVLEQNTGDEDSFRARDVVGADQPPCEIPGDILWSFFAMDHWNSSVLPQAWAIYLNVYKLCKFLMHTQHSADSNHEICRNAQPPTRYTLQVMNM